MKILVIRLKQIGDALLSSPVCESLHRTFPQAQIDYLLYEHIAPLFENHPAIENVLSITPADRRYKIGYLRKVLALRRRRYDIVIDLITVPITALITRFSGAPMQIGFDKGKWRSRLYKTRVPHHGELGALDSKLAILSGLPQTVVVDRTMRICLHEREINDMRRRLLDNGVAADRPVVMFSPISRLGLKNWPSDYFAQLIEKTIDAYDVQVVLIWGPGEREAVQKIAAGVGRPQRVSSGVETRSLRELAALAANCAVFVGNDSGPRHVAEAVGTPTFTIFAPDVRKTVWLPNPGERHQALDMTDVLDIDDRQWFARQMDLRANAEQYYRRLTPDFAFAHLRKMLDTIVAAAAAR